MAIHEFTDISIEHLTAEHVARSEAGNLPFDMMTYDYGWVVSTAKFIPGPLCDCSIRDLRGSGLSPEVTATIQRAERRKCWLWRFDMDADFDPDLPVGGYGMDP